MAFDMSKAREAVEGGMGEAQELIKDPSKVKDLLAELEEKLTNIPVAGEILADIPLTISMIRSYIRKEYTQVSPKVIITLISAFIYLVKNRDIIPDNIPLVGRIDDIAVLGFALKFVEPELKAYAQWKETQKDAPEAASEEAAAEEAPEEIPEEIPEDAVPEEAPEQIPEETPEDAVPEEAPEQVTEEAPEEAPQETQDGEEMSWEAFSD